MSNTKKYGTAEKRESPNDVDLGNTLRCLAVVGHICGDVRSKLRPAMPSAHGPSITMYGTYCSAASLLSRSEVSSPLACACAICGTTPSEAGLRKRWRYSYLDVQNLDLAGQLKHLVLDLPDLERVG